MKDKKQMIISLSLTGLLLSSGANATSDEVEPMAAPPFSAAQLVAAEEDGVDLRKANLRPGLHIVTLAESWSTDEQSKAIRTQIDQQQRQGFYDAGVEELVDMRTALKAEVANMSGNAARHDRSFTSVEEVQAALRVTPIGLGTSGLSPAHTLDVRISGGLVGGRWTGLTRTFDLPDLGVVVLNETDHVAGHESVSVIKEWINVDIHGQPGSVRTARDASGKTLVTVGWANERKIYSLRLQPQHPEQRDLNQLRLIEIAKALQEG